MGFLTVDVHVAAGLHGPLMWAVFVTVFVAVAETVTVKVIVACAVAARWTVAFTVVPVTVRLVQSAAGVHVSVPVS